MTEPVRSTVMIVSTIEVDAGVLILETQSELHNNSGIKGGAFFCGSQSRLVATHVSSTLNDADEGSLIYAGTSVSVVVASLRSDGDLAQTGVIFAGRDSDVSVTESTLANSTVSTGVLYADNAGTIRVATSTFIGNHASGSGAALHIDSCKHLEVASTLFHGNVAEADGGAVYLRRAGAEGPVVFRSSRFNGNAATQHGGALALDGSNAVIVNTDFVGNNALWAGAGVIFNRASAQSTNSSFVGNTAVYGGSWLLTPGTTFESTGGTLFQGNVATRDGGCFVLQPGGETITHRDDRGFRSNLAGGGGGIFYYEFEPGVSLPTIVEGIPVDGNEAAYGPVRASDVVSILVEHVGESEANLVPFKEPITVTALDHELQVCMTTQALITIAPLDDEVLIIGGDTITFKEGVGRTGDDFKLQHLPDRDVHLNVSVELSTSTTLTEQLRIYLRPCVFGEHLDVDGGSVCSSCSGSTEYTLEAGSDGCNSCPNHVTCEAGENDVYPGAAFILESNYWRSGPQSENVRSCLFDDSCGGGINLFEVKSSCVKNHRGPLCALCRRGFVLNKNTGRCIECTKGGKREVVVTLSVFASLLFAMVVGLVYVKQYFPVVYGEIQERAHEMKESLHRRGRRLLPMIKIFFVFAQIAATQHAAFSFISFPGRYTSVANGLRISVSFSLYSVLARLCHRSSHYEALLVSTLIPIGLLILIGFVYSEATRRLERRVREKTKKMQHSRDRQSSLARLRSMLFLQQPQNEACHLEHHLEERLKLRNYATYAALLMLYIVYPGVSTCIFQTFRCDSKFRASDGEPKHSEYLNNVLLEADMSISCETGTYLGYMVYAIFMIFCYPLGVPLCFFLLLWTRRFTINPKDVLGLAERIRERGVAWNGSPRGIGEDVQVKAYDSDPQSGEDDGDVADVRSPPHTPNPSDTDDMVRVLVHKSQETVAEIHECHTSLEDVAEHNELYCKAVDYIQVSEFIQVAPERARERLMPAFNRLGEDLVCLNNQLETTTSHLSFLFIDYDPTFWWFESLECMRRLLLTSILPAVFSAENHLGLIYATLLMASVFFVVYIGMRPFAIDDVDHFSVLMQGTLTLIIYFTLILYVEDNIGDLRGHWNREAIGIVLSLLAAFLGPVAILFQVRRDEHIGELFSNTELAKLKDKYAKEMNKFREAVPLYKEKVQFAFLRKSTDRLSNAARPTVANACDPDDPAGSEEPIHAAYETDVAG